MSGAAHPFVSRGGLKLRHALDVFSGGEHGLRVEGAVCADFGCSTGGFTDCLLQAGATRVYAVDTAYGELAWKLRNDVRVTVMERTNCLHAARPVDAAGGVDLVVADAGWTPQRLLIPAGLGWLAPEGRMISLIKPHYEQKERTAGGVLAEGDAEALVRSVVAEFGGMGARCLGVVKSPILGGSKGKGNAEWLALVAPA